MIENEAKGLANGYMKYEQIHKQTELFLLKSWLKRTILFWTMRREYARILGEGTPFWGYGAPGPQREIVSIS
jgi:hypothetical protein